MKCIKCAHEYEGKFCPECGTPAEIICPKCNISITGKFCSECGYSALQQEEPKRTSGYDFKLRSDTPSSAPAQPQQMYNNDFKLRQENSSPYQAQVPTQPYQQPPQPQYQQPPIIINNMNTNTNTNTNTNQNMGMGYMRPKSKWVALALCFFLGFVGAHKFYEGKTGMGILYIFTLGLFGIGIFVDFIVLLFKPNPYFY